MRSSLVPGVGKRTAQRLIIELKARFEVPDLDLSAVGGSRDDAPVPRCATRSSGSGTRPRRCATVVGQLAEDGTVEDLLRDALRVAGRLPMREELLSPTADPAEAAEETTLRPQAARRVRRPAAVA